MRQNKYWQIARIYLQNGLVYRLNFAMWRVRSFIQLLALYLLWNAVSQGSAQVLSYTQQAVLTYVLGASIIRNLVLNTRTADIQGEISSGDLNNHLIKPYNYFLNWISRDAADKSLNLVFSFFELILVFLLFKPPVFIQTNLEVWVLFFTSLLLATILFFIISTVISMTTFWFYQFNGWAQRFLVIVLVESFAGGLFPLDLLPTQFAKLIQLMPTSYLVYFPLQIYLGRIDPKTAIEGFAITLVWITIFSVVAKYLWHRGLKTYGAYGR